jgi:hypothetical protein
MQSMICRNGTEVASIYQVFTVDKEGKRMDEPQGKDWRELCAAAAIEPDSEKLVNLVQQILQAFDERDQAALLSGISNQHLS